MEGSLEVAMLVYPDCTSRSLARPIVQRGGGGRGQWVEKNSRGKKILNGLE
jgi:hypothetical protein